MTSPQIKYVFDVLGTSFKHFSPETSRPRRSGKKRRKNFSGFTLIEILLTASLVTIVSVAAYQCLVNGYKIWERSQRASVEEDIGIALDKIGQDIRNVFSFSLIQFDGRSDRLTLPTIIHTLADKKSMSPGEMAFQMGKMEYAFNAGKLVRRQARYGQALEDDFDPDQVLCSSLHSVRFSYYVVTPQKREILGRVKEIPAAVIVQFEFVEETGQMRKMEKLIEIPITYAHYEEEKSRL